MPDASWFQNDFSGGEISPDAAGNFDDPMYGKSLILCRNNLVLPTKSVERRGGTRIIGHVQSGNNNYYKLFALVANNGTPFLAEFSANCITISGGSSNQGGLHLMGSPEHAWRQSSGFHQRCRCACRSTRSWTLTTPSRPSTRRARQCSRSARRLLLRGRPATGSASTSMTRTRRRARSCGAQTYTVTMLTATTFTVSSLTGDGITVNASALVNRTSYSKIYVGHHWNSRHPTIDDYITVWRPDRADNDHPARTT